MEFEDLDAWKVARELVSEIYRICRSSDELSRDYGLRAQVQRAAVFVMSDLAEGFERSNRGEKKQHYNIARASCGEVRSLLYVLLDSEFISPTEFSALKNKTIRSGMLISGLLRSLDTPS